MHAIALPDVAQEIALTRRILERVPEEKFDWKPHEKSWSLAELATHTAAILGWQHGILGRETFNLAEVGPPLEAVASQDELLAFFDAQAGDFQEAIEAASLDELRAEWTIRHGDDVISRQPRVAALRTTCLSHMIHHRGQLTVYLRLLDVPLPPIYGPTADEEVSWGT